MRHSFSHSGRQCAPVSHSCGLAPGHDAEVPSLVRRVRTQDLFLVPLLGVPRIVGGAAEMKERNHGGCHRMSAAYLFSVSS